MYQEYKPNIFLSQFIETYWTAYGYVEGTEMSKIFPDGCVDIIFTFGDKPTREGLKPFCPYVVGTITSFIEVEYTGKVQMFGIRFSPVGITAFTRIPINEFTNRQVDVNLLETLFDKQFHNILPEKHTLKDKIQYIDNYLLSKLHLAFDIDKLIVYSVSLIKSTHGLLSPSKVAEEICLCQRHFERKFKLAVGISPKTFSKIIRFKYALHHLKTNRNLGLDTLAINCGYYDYAHLIKDFKYFTGESPSNFRG